MSLYTWNSPPSNLPGSVDTLIQAVRDCDYLNSLTPEDRAAEIKRRIDSLPPTRPGLPTPEEQERELDALFNT